MAICSTKRDIAEWRKFTIANQCGYATREMVSSIANPENRVIAEVMLEFGLIGIDAEMRLRHPGRDIEW